MALVKDMREPQLPACFLSPVTPFAEVCEETVEQGSENGTDTKAQPESPFSPSFMGSAFFVLLSHHTRKQGGAEKRLQFDPNSNCLDGQRSVFNS